MTYREKLKQDRPEKVSPFYKGGCVGCPGSFYKDAPHVSNWACKNTPSDCTACWDREMPGTEEQRKVVYIAGPITGVPEYWAPFEKAEDELTRRGYIALSPSRLPTGMTREQYGRICAAMIDSADAVFVLPNWASSRGAAIEVSYSTYIGKPLFHDYDDLKEGLKA